MISCQNGTNARRDIRHSHVSWSCGSCIGQVGFSGYSSFLQCMRAHERKHQYQPEFILQNDTITCFITFKLKLIKGPLKLLSHYHIYYTYDLLYLKYVFLFQLHTLPPEYHSLH